jgi:feruloyl esterase
VRGALRPAGARFPRPSRGPTPWRPGRHPRSRGRVNLPAHCRVEGTIDRRAGAEGKPYGVGFAIALPDAWNGRFLFQGGGGLNGTVGLPLGAQASGDSPALVRGFAVVSTDTGHQASGGAFDAAFMRDQQAVLDFEYVAIGRVAVLAKEIVARYYGRPADHSYFAGCSTGGREAMLMAQVPAYFDGVIRALRRCVRMPGLGDRGRDDAESGAPKDAAGSHPRRFSTRQTAIVNALPARAMRRVAPATAW